jgi:phage-related protein
MAVNLGTASGQIVIDGSGAERGFSVAQAAAESFFNVLQSRIGDMEQLGRRLQGVGAIAATGFGVAINSAASFEQALSGIEAVSGATEAQMSKISAAALRIGKDSVYSATEAAGAIEEIIKAGVSVEDALSGAADAAVGLAAAGGIGLPEAASIASNALNVFNLEGRDMAHVADLIAGAANASAIDVSDFGMSLSQSGAVANLAGVSFDDLSVAIAEMGQAGIKGSDAGTSIKTFLTNLIPTTDQQIGLFEKLGLVSVKSGIDMARLAKMGIKPTSRAYDDVSDAISKYVQESGGAKVGTAANNKETMKMGTQLGALSNEFFNAEGNARSFSEIQGKLTKATAGMTKEQKLQTLEVLFGSDALRAAAVFADEGSKGFDAMAASMGKVTAQSVAATRLDNLRGSLEQLKGSLETAAITIGSVFLPMARRIVDVITRVVNAFNNAPPGLQKFMAITIGVGAALAALVGTILTLLVPVSMLLAKFLGFAVLKSIFSIFTAGFAALRGGAGIMAAVAAAAARAGVVFSRLGKIGGILFRVLRAIPGVFMLLRGIGGVVFGPIGLAISLVVTALTLLYQHFAPFRNLVNSVASAVKGGLVAGLQMLRNALGLVGQGFAEGKASGSGFVGFLQSIGAGARVLWDALVRLGQAFMNNVVPALRAAGALLKGSLLTAWKQISSAVTSSLLPALIQLRDAFAPLMPYLAQFGSFLLKVIGAVLKVAGVVAGVLLLALVKLATLFATYVLPAIIKFVAFILSTLVPAIAQIITWIIQFVAAAIRFGASIVSMWTSASDATTSGVGWLKTALAGIGAFFVSVFSAIKGFVVGVFTAIWTFIQTAMSTISTIITTVLNTIRALWAAFWSSSFGQLVQNAIGLVVDIVKLGIALVVLAIVSAMALIRVVWNATWNFLSAVVSTVWGAIKTVVSAAATAVVGAVSAAWNAIKAATSAVWSAVRAAVSAAWSKIRAVVAPAVAAVRSVVTSAWNAVKSATSAAWNAVASAVSNAVSRAWSTVVARTAGIRSAISSAWNAAKSATASIWNAIVTAVTSGISKMMTRVRQIKSDVVGAFAGAASWLLSAGANIVNGLIGGIGSKISAARAKVQELTGLVRRAAEQALKIGSPSKVFRDIGKFVGEGFIQGITGTQAKVRSSVTRMADMVKNAYSRRADAIRAIGRQLDTLEARRAAARRKVADVADRLDQRGNTKKQTASLKRQLANYRDSVKAINRQIGNAKADKKALGSLTGRARDRALNAISDVNGRLNGIAKKREQLADKIKAATAKVAEAVKLRADYSASVRDAVNATGDVTNFRDQTGASSATSIVAGMREALLRAQKFKSMIEQLKSRGLSNTVLQDIVDKGVDNGSATAEALLAGGTKAIKDVNYLQWKLGTVARSMGEKTSGWFYKSGVDAANGLLSGLKSQESKLAAVAQRIAEKLTRAIRKALKIKSPSRVMAGLGSDTIAGFILGMEAEMGSLQKMMSTMATTVPSTVTPYVAGMARPAPRPVRNTTQSADTRPVVNQDIKIINPERERDSKGIDESLQMAGAFL